MGVERLTTKTARKAARLAARSDAILSEGENLRATLDAELAALAAMDEDEDDYTPKSCKTYKPRPCMKCDTTFTPTYDHNTVCPKCQQSDAWRLGIAPHHDTRLDGGRR